jgi:hypothetical protein
MNKNPCYNCLLVPVCSRKSCKSILGLCDILRKYLIEEATKLFTPKDIESKTLAMKTRYIHIEEIDKYYNLCFSKKVGAFIGQVNQMIAKEMCLKVRSIKMRNGGTDVNTYEESM